MNNDKNYAADINRISTENCKKASDLLNDICNQIQGNKTLPEVIKDSDLYCDTYKLLMAATGRAVQHDRKELAYDDEHNMEELLRQLFDRLYFFYHNGAAKGRDLPGIRWTMDNGTFVVWLNSCAINMEHSVEVTESTGTGFSITKRGKVFNLWLDIPDMEDDPNGVDLGYKYVGFSADFTSTDGECEDVTFAPDDQDFKHLTLVRSILADFDMIGDMIQEKENQ